ncbi:uncharacterized protein B0H64DRAFT_378738 [Chaetomium fimeti]|uniref:Uncharacterized protein n=1 Tax=Chaetomium fimeti TaxID=1854472 RepID=A0AAE0LMW4_9PEZI|nr:hypothetical protein B0H64DRAFT_378738 [Chaetomium fimeti]
MDAIHNTPETTHTSLWADVRNYIERKGRLAWDRAPPIAICSICQVTELDILGLPPSEEAVASIEPAMITICGHMACYICLETWMFLVRYPKEGPNLTRAMAVGAYTSEVGRWCQLAGSGTCSLRAVNKSTVEDARVRENYEHPSWGAQWDSEEAVLPSDVE